MIDLVNANAYEHIKTIQDKSIDLIITDPPYLIPNSRQGSAKAIKKMNHWQTLDECGDSLRAGFELSLLDEFYRIQPFLNLYIFCNAKLLQVLMSYYLYKGFTNCEVLILNKLNPIPAYKGHYLPDMEYILYVCENKSSLNIDSVSGKKLFQVSIPFTRYTNHPTEKPLQVIEQLVLNSSKENQTIYDPFSGSGVVASACKSLNRNFIGTELNEKYYKESIVRLKNNIGRLL